MLVNQHAHCDPDRAVDQSANFATVDDYNVGHDTAHLQACLHLLAEHDV